MRLKKGENSSFVRKQGLSKTDTSKTRKILKKKTSRQKTLELATVNKALRKSEAILRSVFSASPAGILLITSERKISWMNERITSITGYTLKDLQDKGPQIFYADEEEFARVGRSVFQKVLQGNSIEADTRWIRKDGQMRDIHLSVAPIDPNDNALGQVSIVMDITDRKQVERELMSTKDYLKTVFNKIHDALFVFDLTGKVVDVNEKLVELYKCSREEALGLNILHDFSATETPIKDYHANVLWQKVMAGEDQLFEWKAKRPGDGSIFDVEVTLTKLSLPQGDFILSSVRDITERKQAEEALRESENKFRDLAEKSIVGIYLIQNNIFRYVNARFAEIHGYTIEDLIDKKGTLETILPEDLLKVSEDIEKRISGEIAFVHTEFRIITKQQEIKTVEIYGTHTIYRGKPAIIGTLLDITERKKMEKQLWESERKYRNIFENAVEGIFQTTPEGQFLSVNPAHARIVGFDSPEALIASTTGMVKALYVNPEDRQVLIDRVETYGSVKGFETRHVRKDGKIVWVSINIRAVRDESGRTIYLEGTTTDITERKFAEEALQESEAKYRNVVDHLLVGFYIIQDYRFCFVNRRFCEMSGYSYDELVNKEISPLDLVHDDDKEFIGGLIVKRLAGEMDHEGSVYKGMTKDGQVMILKGISNLMIYNGRPAVEGGLIDITREITLESQLRQAQKMEAVGTLAGGIAHDFNNILTAIIGYGRLLQMKMAETDPLRTYVAHILSSSETAANLTRNLLTFSRKQIVELKPVTVGIIIKGMERLLKSLLTEDIELKIISPDSDVTIMADMSQIEQVLLNLASNANDAMPRGGTLTIETKEIELKNILVDGYDSVEPGQYALISIADTGAGIDEKIRDKIFEPFFTTKEVGKGTGLGLSIVHGIVDQHHGYITVKSKPRGGTVFHIYLPVVKTAIEETETISPAAEGGTETILVAEDDAQVRGLTTEILNSAGYTIIEAIDGEDAVKKFVEHSDTVELLLLDVVMPRKNGKEAYDEIKKINPDIRVIFMSGYTGDVIISKGIIGKECDFVQKPLSPNELLIRVREVLDK